MESRSSDPSGVLFMVDLELVGGGIHFTSCLYFILLLKNEIFAVESQTLT